MKNNHQHGLLIKRAQENPWIADFELTLEEIENNIVNIHKIFKAKDNCANFNNSNLCGNNGYHFKLAKDKQGQIFLTTYPCPKNILNKGFLIKNNYIYNSINMASYEQLLDKKSIIIPTNSSQQDRIKFLNFLLKIKRHENEIKGFYVYGDIGVGKTYLTIAFCNEMALQNKKISYLLMNNFCLDIIQNIKQQKDLGELIENLKVVDILVLDELGSEKYNAYIHNQILYSILNYRLHTNKITIFCSKFDLKALKGIYKLSSRDQNIENFIERVNNLSANNIFNLKTKII